MIIDCLLCEYPVDIIDGKAYDVIVSMCSGFGGKRGMTTTEEIHECEEEDWDE